MIVTRAPLRISFVGGGTDMADFYREYPGRVISTAIDKYVYLVINRTPLIDKISARYSISETVDTPEELQHTRIKHALLDLGIPAGIEIASFASLPSRTGLGSSSTFSVALMKGLHAYKGKQIDPGEAAEAASRLEIELVGEPIGKQDQYAAAFGGFNVFQFNADGSVKVEPVLLDYRKRLAFEDHMLVFFTGTTRDAGSVLKEQKANIQSKFDTLKEMSDSVPKFATLLAEAKFEELGKMLDVAWQKKKTLTSKTSNPLIDAMYDAGMASGAWGGKLIGAGAGGCVMFLASPQKHAAIREAVQAAAKANHAEGFKELPIKFVQSGVEVLFNGDHFHHFT